MNMYSTTCRNSFWQVCFVAPCCHHGFLLIIAALVASSAACVWSPTTAAARMRATDVSGPITTNTTWHAVDSPFTLVGDVTVAVNATLTIEPGVVVQGTAQTGLLVRGRLNAIGTPTQPITLTSTLNSGPSQWKGLTFDGNSGQGTGTLRHVRVSYGGIYNGASRANVTVHSVLNGEVQIESSHINGVGGFPIGEEHGLTIYNSQVVVSDTLFTQNGDGESDYAIFTTGASTIVTVTNSTLFDNIGSGFGMIEGTAQMRCTTIAQHTYEGIYLLGATLKSVGSEVSGSGGLAVNNAGFAQADMRYTWWGDPSGPFHVTANPEGTANGVNDGVLVIPWLRAKSCVVPDLTVTLVDAPDPVVVGNSLTYSVVITNISPDVLTLTQVRVTDTLAAEVVLAGVETSQGSCAPGGSVIVCDLGTLVSGASALVTIHVTPTIAGFITSEVTVTAAEGDAVPEDNGATASTVVIASASDPAISDFAPPHLLHGATRTLTIKGQNFVDGATVTLVRGNRGEPDPGDVVGTVISSTADSIVAQFEIVPYDYLGEWDVVVEFPNDKLAVRPILILPSLIYPALRGMGTLGFPVGRDRTNYVEIVNVGNDDGVVWLEIAPPEPDKIHLQIGTLWDSKEETEPSSAHLLIELAQLESIQLPMTWNVPPEHVIFPDALAARAVPYALLQENGIIVNQNQTVSWKGVKGATKDQLKGMVKQVLLDTACQSLGQKLAGLDPAVIDTAINNAVSTLEGATTPGNLVSQVGSFLGEKFIPGFGQVSLALDVTNCLNTIVAGILQAFDKAAKGAADRLRAQTGGRTRDALAEATRQISDQAKPNLFWFSAVTREGGLVSQLDKPPCNPPLASQGGYAARVRAPWDPNDKNAYSTLPCMAVEVEGVLRCVRYFVPPAVPLDYVIQFENKKEATAEAEDVVITDILADTLDPSTVEVLNSSHPDTFSMEVSGQTVTFRFSGINLPPNQNPPQGEGFVAFTVQPRAGLSLGTQIPNRASIVFDFNPAIQTPEIVHVLARNVYMPVIRHPDNPQMAGAADAACIIAKSD